MLDAFRSGSSATRSKEETVRGLSIYFKLASAYQKQGNFADALKNYREALSLAEKAGITDTVEVAYIYNGLANAYLHQDKLDEAQTNLDKESQILNKSASERDIKPQIVKNLYLKASILEKKGQYDQALEIFKQALKGTEGLAGEELANDLLAIHDAMAEIYRNKGDITQACQQWKKGIDVATKQYGEDSLEVKDFNESLAWALLDQQKFEDALTYANKCVQASKKHFGEDGSEVTSSLFLLGHIHAKQGDNTKAFKAYEEALKILQKDPKENAEQMSYGYMLMAKIYWGKQDTKNAKENFEKAVKALIDAYGENDLALAKCYTTWGKLLRKNILSMDDAKIAFKKALEILKKGKAEDQAGLASLYSYLGEIEYYEDNFDEALKWYNEFAKTSSSGNIDPELCEEVYSFMGAIYSKQGKMDDSIKYHEKAVKSCGEVAEDHSNLDYHYRNLGEAYEKGGKLDKAREIYQKNLDLSARRHGKEDETTQRSAGLVADVLKKMNKHEEAEKLLKTYGK